MNAPNRSQVALAVMIAITGVLWLHYHPKSAKSQLFLRPALQTRATLTNTTVIKRPLVSEAIEASAGILPVKRPPTPISVIVDQDAPYSARVAMISASFTNIDDQDREFLYAYLRTGSPLDGGQREQVIKNQLLDHLCSLHPPPAGLASVLIDMYENTNQNVVLRDYAVQHMVDVYETTMTSRSARSASDITGVLWDALNNTESSIAGTALLALEQLSEHWPDEFGRERISDAAVRIANDPMTGELTRITAFQLCAEMKVRDSVPLLQDAAKNARSIPLRISAIAALGTMADAGSEALLKQLAGDSEARINMPAREALRRIGLDKTP